jgi:hypothetical protein
MENLQDIKLPQTRCQNFSMSKIDSLQYVGHGDGTFLDVKNRQSTICRPWRWNVCLEGRGGSQEVVRPMATSQLKMENACIFCNVIEIF